MRPALRDTASERVQTRGTQTASGQLDRRSKRTRRALRDALAAEIEEAGDLSQVTVTAVSDRAGVTRRTFYSHFKDIPDLVNAIEDETVADLRPLVEHLACSSLDQLENAISHFRPCPGSVEILTYFTERPYLRPLLGEGGDPAFSQRVKRMARETVQDRALDGLDVRAIPFFDYYLTFAISAEVGVLERWLATGMEESVPAMARLMTALMFVRPGDLYGKSLEFDVNAICLDMLDMKETDHD